MNKEKLIKDLIDKIEKYEKELNINDGLVSISFIIIIQEIEDILNDIRGGKYE